MYAVVGLRAHVIVVCESHSRVVRDNGEFYESFVRKQGWRFTARCNVILRGRSPRDPKGGIGGSVLRFFDVKKNLN